MNKNEIFISNIKKEFKAFGEELILIEGGDVFAGSWDQLERDFYIDSTEIDDFCSYNAYVYEII